MSTFPGDTIKFRDGAQQLDLPDGAKKSFIGLQEVVKKESPRMERDGNKTLYRYNRTPECTKFSKQVLPSKVGNLASETNSLADRTGGSGYYENSILRRVETRIR
jgi:hypothetical protein